MPIPLLNAYAEKLPRLTAEESLHAAERIAVGTGSLRRGQGRRITAAWERMAKQDRPKVRAGTREMYRAQMGAYGIGVKSVPVKRDG